MKERVGALGIGLGAALAVSLPAMLVAQILDATLDGDLPVGVTVPLSLVALGGAVVGGIVVGGRAERRPRSAAALVGAVALGAIAVLGTVRRSAAGDDPVVLLVPVAIVVGSMLGMLGGALRTSRPGRTRP